MQLNKRKSIRSALTAITATLIGTGVTHASSNTQVESSILLYSERNRVQAAEGILSLSHALTGGRLLNARLTLDALTGASPNGATPSSHIQTFTRPSGNGSYTVKPGEIPLDDTFKDTRYSFDGSYTRPLDHLTPLVLGAHLSTEHDYTSLGANAGISRDFNRRNTTLSLSVALSHDIVRPQGGAPIPLSLMTAPGEGEREREDDDEGGEGSSSSEGKNVVDAVFGITQVLDRKTVLRLNYSSSHSSGYLNDPYKLLSIVQEPTSAEAGEPLRYVYESRPDSHLKHALFAELRRYLGGQTMSLSYRYYWDDWGINSHTVDLRYRIPMSNGHALQPHFRWYKQTGADFYRTYLLDGASQSVHASADYRLAPFHAVTLGLQYLFPVSRNAHLSIGAEYYYQSGDLSPPASMGVLSRYELFPKLDAAIVRVGFSHDI